VKLWKEADMADDKQDLESRLTKLEDIEAIRAVKHKYWRCIDREQWDEIADCFTEDATGDYMPTMRPQGNVAIAQFIKKWQTKRKMTSCVHQGHNPEIEITDDTTAKGMWELYNFMIEADTNRAWRVLGFYDDEFAKVDGEWRIKSLKLTIVLSEQWERSRP